MKENECNRNIHIESISCPLKKWLLEAGFSIEDASRLLKVPVEWLACCPKKYSEGIFRIISEHGVSGNE